MSHPPLVPQLSFVFWNTVSKRKLARVLFSLCSLHLSSKWNTTFPIPGLFFRKRFWNHHKPRTIAPMAPYFPSVSRSSCSPVAFSKPHKLSPPPSLSFVAVTSWTFPTRSPCSWLTFRPLSFLFLCSLVLQLSMSSLLCSPYVTTSDSTLFSNSVASLEFVMCEVFVLSPSALPTFLHLS